MELLEPVTQPYAWGSHTAIAELQGRRVPTAQPEAELWMGAHPSAPSGVALPGGGHTTLDAMIAADPVRELGAECVARFGGRLPFLLKVLAAETALSIQVHPSRQQAEAGFRAENERGLAPGDKSRNYVDDWPKPEILCALTPFEALAGMRAPQDAAALLKELAVGELDPIAAILAGASGPEALTEALAAILAWPPDRRPALVAEVAAGCAVVAAGGGPYAAACAAAVRLSREHPGDLGVVASLLLRHSVLAPGPGDLPAGRRTARLPARHRGGAPRQLRQRGPGRADRQAHRRARAAQADRPGRRRARARAARARRRPVRLRLARAGVPAVPGRARPRPRSPCPGRTAPGSCSAPRARRVLRAGGGEVGRDLTVGRGESCFVAAGDGAVTVAGPATVFVAASGLDPMPSAW